MSGVTFLELDVVDSTQDEVLTRLTSVEPGAIVAVTARSQRAGRGREGRTWHDAPGEALLLSVGRRGPLPMSVLADLPRRVADALLHALDAAGRIRWKAPNDLVDSDGAKLAGILVDARTTGAHVDHVIVGVGLNLSGTPFTTPDGRAATTLDALGAHTSATILRDALVGAVDARR